MIITIIVKIIIKNYFTIFPNLSEGDSCALCVCSLLWTCIFCVITFALQDFRLFFVLPLITSNVHLFSGLVSGSRNVYVSQSFHAKCLSTF